MASEQRGARKKQTKNLSREENCHPVLYRHQDCIPSQKLLQNCERLNIRNNQDLEYHGKSSNEQETNYLKNKSKQLNSKVKNGEKSENNYQKSTLNPQQSNDSEGNNEELSKSRKRRLRKQRLLVSLAPSSSNTKPNPPEARTLTTSLPIARPITAATLTTTASNNKTSDSPKPSAKDSRKRLDKIVGSRNKSIKTKTLADNTYQSRTDIIKTLEEKTLNSLLQTLVPLTNSSPKKEKASVPLFSFPEKRLNTCDSKVDKDGVFYFGETKNQLEKLTSEPIKCNTSHLQDNSEAAPNVEFNRNFFSGSKLNNFEDCVSSLNFSTAGQETLTTLTALKQNLYETKSKRAFSLSNSEKEKDLAFNTPVLKDLSQFPIIRVLDLTRPPVCSSLTSVTNNPGVIESFIEKTDNITKSTDITPCIGDTTVCLLEEETKSSQINPLEVITKYHSVMSSMEETNKSKKSREEVILEREAKKAAKLAAKAKFKTPELSNTSILNNKTSKLENKVNTQEQEDIKSEKRDTQPNLKTQSFSQESENNVPNVQVASSDKLFLSSQNKEKAHHFEIAESPENLGKDLPAKSKAELKAERRAKQEAQRAAKATSKIVQSKPKEKVVTQVKQEQPNKVVTSTVEAEKKPDVVKTSSQPKPKLFSHLYQEKTLFTSNEVLKVGGLHPAIVRLGVQYAARVVVGSNARCVALLHALKQMVNDYTTPLEKEFSRGLEEELGPVTVFLNQCRPLAVSMTNALRHIKRTLTQLPNSISDLEARRKICDVVDTYIHEQVDVAGKAICNTVKQKIANGDVILTYGCSSLIYQILVESHLSGTKFRVVVVDGLPWREGREMLRRLVEKGLSCTYVLVTAASFIMREASKVLLGAHALLANGYVMSRAGSSQMALLAHCYNVPVLVCCETHKFCERVQTDAFVYNELGELSCDNIKEKDKGRVLTSLTPMSLAYDITPPDLVSAVVTELAVLPCTSVPVILRIKPSESVM